MRTLVDIPKHLEQLSLALGEEAVFIDQIELEGLVVQLAGPASERLLVFSEIGFFAHPLLIMAIFPRFSTGVAGLIGVDGLIGPAAWKAFGFPRVAEALDAFLKDASSAVIVWATSVFDHVGACPIAAIEAVAADNGSPEQMDTRLRFSSAGLRDVLSELPG